MLVYKFLKLAYLLKSSTLQISTFFTSGDALVAYNSTGNRRRFDVSS